MQDHDCWRFAKGMDLGEALRRLAPSVSPEIYNLVRQGELFE